MKEDSSSTRDCVAGVTMSEEVVAEVWQGRLRGRKVKSAAGGEYYSFQGIPYAKPPVGPLRFRPPERPEKWDGIWDATHEQECSPSINYFTKKYEGQEDCLFVNVYTSQWPAKQIKPVMVWLHGGGFFVGSGNTDLHGPDFLVVEDILLVTLNYRLGALGFLNLEGSDVSTNNGLRDQVMALTWVKENIAQFGGDPHNVTICGVSAGGCSVHHMMLSPSAKGLFHRAISMSGTALIPLCFNSHDISVQRALRLAKALGCDSAEPQEIADFLRNVPAEEIVKTQQKLMEEQERFGLPIIPILPTEEIGSDRFYPEHPENLMKNGNFNKVPFITGVTSAEGKLLFQFKDLKEVIDNLDCIVPWDLTLMNDTDRKKEVATKLKQFYFSDASGEKDMLARLVDMQSDLWFVYPMYAAVKLHVNSSDSPVYVYVFDHTAPRDIFPFSPPLMPDVPGTPHGDCFTYLFYTEMKPNVFPPGTAEATVRSNMLRLWTQFAKTGCLSDGESKLSWPPVTKDNFQYLKIGQSLTVETDLFKERMDFMEDVYKTFKLNNQEEREKKTKSCRKE